MFFTCIVLGFKIKIKFYQAHGSSVAEMLRTQHKLETFARKAALDMCFCVFYFFILVLGIAHV